MVCRKGWSPRAHQLELMARARGGENMLLIAPTGAGKTLGGFMASLTDLAERGKVPPGSGFVGVHTLYISPLKALAVDIERTTRPVSEMGLPIVIETRTGDTPQAKRQRQKVKPPDILLTTPEQVSLLLANKEAERFFRDLKYVVLDELHSLVTSNAATCCRWRSHGCVGTLLTCASSAFRPRWRSRWICVVTLRHRGKVSRRPASSRWRVEQNRTFPFCTRKNAFHGLATPRVMPARTYTRR